MCGHLEGGGDVTVAEDLHELATFGVTGGGEDLEVDHLGAGGLCEGLQGGDVDGLLFNPGGVLESELGKTPLNRHLTAFVTDLVLVTGTGLCTFGTTGGGTAFAGALAAADALAVVGGTLGGFEIFKFHLAFLLSQFPQP